MGVSVRASQHKSNSLHPGFSRWSFFLFFFSSILSVCEISPGPKPDKLGRQFIRQFYVTMCKRCLLFFFCETCKVCVVSKILNLKEIHSETHCYALELLSVMGSCTFTVLLHEVGSFNCMSNELHSISGFTATRSVLQFLLPLSVTSNISFSVDKVIKRAVFLRFCKTVAPAGRYAEVQRKRSFFYPTFPLRDLTICTTTVCMINTIHRTGYALIELKHTPY